MIEKNDFYCYLCAFMFLVILTFCLIGQKEKEIQDVNIKNSIPLQIQKGEPNVTR